MKNKIERLTEHYERIIFLNSVYHYTQSGNPKIEKYYKLLKQIRTQFILNGFNPSTRTKLFNPMLNPLKQLKSC